MQLAAFFIVTGSARAEGAGEQNNGPAAVATMEAAGAAVNAAMDKAAKAAPDLSAFGNEKLKEAIAAAYTDGKLDMNAKPGFLGIPGGPKVNVVLAFLWAIWVGWIFSSVGTFSGVMASVN